jgi:hypothetical protein
MIGYLLKIATEPIGNNEGLADGKVHQVPRWPMGVWLSIDSRSLSR